MPANKRIYVAGHKGMVGSALVGALEKDSKNTIIAKTRAELDLVDQAAVNTFFLDNEIDEVYVAAAKVGGIVANNNYPADFIYENLMIESNLIHAAFKAGITKLLFLGSSCIYPRLAKQPMREDALLTGVLEPTNEPYAIAKIAGIKLCESYNRQYGTDYRSVMPTNLYGPNDNFHPDNSHVIPAMMRRFHFAKENDEKAVTVWGTGEPQREFLHVKDMAAACIFVMNLEKAIFNQNIQPMLSHFNVGTGVDVRISELAYTIKEVVGFDGDIVFDTSKPDGAPRKLMDVTRINDLGWHAKISLEDGLKDTYKWFLEHQLELRGY